MLTHFNLYANALQGEAWMAGAEYRKEIFYAILPMFHPTRRSGTIGVPFPPSTLMKVIGPKEEPFLFPGGLFRPC